MTPSNDHQQPKRFRKEADIDELLEARGPKQKRTKAIDAAGSEETPQATGMNDLARTEARQSIAALFTKVFTESAQTGSPHADTVHGGSSPSIPRTHAPARATPSTPTPPQGFQEEHKAQQRGHAAHQELQRGHLGQRQGAESGCGEAGEGVQPQEGEEAEAAVDEEESDAPLPPWEDLQGLGLAVEAAAYQLHCQSSGGCGARGADYKGYKAAVRNLAANLRRNPALRAQVVCGALPPARLVRLTPAEVATQAQRAALGAAHERLLRRATLHESGEEGGVTSDCTCPVCKSRACGVLDAGRRDIGKSETWGARHDEGRGRVARCLTCGHKWEVND